MFFIRIFFRVRVPASPLAVLCTLCSSVHIDLGDVMFSPAPCVFVRDASLSLFGLILRHIPASG